MHAIDTMACSVCLIGCDLIGISEFYDLISVSVNASETWSTRFLEEYCYGSSIHLLIFVMLICANNDVVFECLSSPNWDYAFLVSLQYEFTPSFHWANNAQPTCRGQ